MKFPSYLKKSIYSGFTFFLTVLILSLAWATIGSSWTNPSTLEVNTGSGLSVNSWNALLSNFNNLNSKTTLTQVDSGWGACGALKTATCPAGKTVIFGIKWHSATNNNGYSGGGPACYTTNAASANMDVCTIGTSSCSSNLTGDTNWASRVVILCQ